MNRCLGAKPIEKKFLFRISKTLLAFVILAFLISAPTSHAYYDEEYTPRDLEQWLRTFEYDRSRTSIPNTSDCKAYTLEQFIDNGGGVCRDFAYVSAVLLQHLGYDPEILIYKVPDGRWHAVTLFEWGSELWYFSNYELIGPIDGRWEINRGYIYTKKAIDRWMCGYALEVKSEER